MKENIRLYTYFFIAAQIAQVTQPIWLGNLGNLCSKKETSSYYKSSGSKLQKHFPLHMNCAQE